MSKTSKRIVYENDMFPSGAKLSDVDLRTPSESEYDRRLAISQRRTTLYSITEDRMVQSKKYKIGGMNYIVNSCFDLNCSRSADDGLKYLLGMDLQKDSEKVS